MSGLGSIFGGSNTSKINAADLMDFNTFSDVYGNADKTAYNSYVSDSLGQGSNNTTLGVGNDTWGTIGTIGQIGLGGLNALTGMKQMKLAKDAFNFNVMDKNRTYEMAKDAYDKNVARAGSIGKQMNAGKVG